MQKRTASRLLLEVYTGVPVNVPRSIPHSANRQSLGSAQVDQDHIVRPDWYIPMEGSIGADVNQDINLGSIAGYLLQRFDLFGRQVLRPAPPDVLRIGVVCLESRAMHDQPICARLQ